MGETVIFGNYHVFGTGYATVTPLCAPCEAGGVDTATLTDTLEDVTPQA